MQKQQMSDGHIETSDSYAKAAVLNAQKPQMKAGINGQASLWI